MHFGKTIYSNNSFAAELLAIFETLYFVEAHQLHKSIIFYYDCQNVVDLISNEHSILYINVFNSCKYWLRRFADIQIKHCNRKFNQVVDMLAEASRAMKTDCNVIVIFPTP